MSPTRPEKSGERPRSTANRLVLLFTAIGLAIGLAATARLAAVVAATPQGRWFEQDGRLVDPALVVTPATQQRAETLSGLMRDANLLRGRLPLCFAPVDENVSDEAQAACLAAIDDALRAAPSSAELWLFRASVRVRTMDFGEGTLAALRNSYATGAREGWIASGRVVLGLRIWLFLPPDLQELVRADLALVLDNNLAGPLADAYVRDFSLRRVAMPVLNGLPKDLMDRFVWAVRTSLHPSEAEQG